MLRRVALSHGRDLGWNGGAPASPICDGEAPVMVGCGCVPGAPGCHGGSCPGSCGGARECTAGAPECYEVVLGC